MKRTLKAIIYTLFILFGIGGFAYLLAAYPLIAVSIIGGGMVIGLFSSIWESLDN